MANKYFWTISVNGATPVPMDGYANVKRRLQSQAVSTVTMKEVLDDYADPTSLNWMNQISIFRNKVQWFYGWVTDIKRSGSSSDHSVSYVISDPWYFLEHTVFEQIYRWIITAPNSVGTPAFPSSADFYHAGFTLEQMIDLNLINPDGSGHIATGNGGIDSSSGDYWTNNPNNATTFMDSSGYYYYVNHSSHAYVNGYQTDIYLKYYNPGGVSGVYVRNNTRQQIIEALNWAQNVYSEMNGGALPFTFQDSDITPAVDLASSDVKDQMCSEIIKNQLGISPDAVTWFDYSQTPPALKIMQRGFNPSVIVTETIGAANAPYTYKIVDVDSNATISTLSNFKTSNIHPRYDLIAPVVVVNYEYTGTIQGKGYLTTYRDIYPPDSPRSQVNGLVSTLSMQGAQENGQRANLLITPITNVGTGGYNSWDASSPTINNQIYQFWSTQSELFNDPTVAIWGIEMTPRGNSSGQITTNQGSYVPASNFDSYIQQGQVADWMNIPTATESLSATVWFTVNGGDAQHLPVTANITTTNYTPTGKQSFYDSSGDTYAEPLPVGVAQAIYESCQQMQYDGSVTFEEEECSSTVSIGNCLCIQDPKQPTWATMDAMIVSVEESLDTGTTDIEFGVTAHRGAADLVQILRALRTRVLILRPGNKVGDDYSANQTELGDQFAVRDAQIKAGYLGTTSFSTADPSVNTTTPPTWPAVTPSGFNVPTFNINIPNASNSNPSSGYSAGVPVATTAPPTIKPSLIFGDQTGRKLAIRLTDLPENIKLMLMPVQFCDVAGVLPPTTGWVFMPDTTASSGGVF